MPEFIQSWACAFIIGCFIGGAIGFFTAIILAASGRASRMEERMVYDAYNREEKRRGGPEIEIATQGKPEDD